MRFNDLSVQITKDGIDAEEISARLDHYIVIGFEREGRTEHPADIEESKFVKGLVEYLKTAPKPWLDKNEKK